MTGNKWLLQVHGFSIFRDLFSTYEVFKCLDDMVHNIVVLNLSEKVDILF